MWDGCHFTTLFTWIPKTIYKSVHSFILFIHFVLYILQSLARAVLCIVDVEDGARIYRVVVRRRGCFHRGISTNYVVNQWS